MLYMLLSILSFVLGSILAIVFGRLRSIHGHYIVFDGIDEEEASVGVKFYSNVEVIAKRKYIILKNNSQK